MSTQETNLKAIADAIRAKTGETGTIQASKFAEKIKGITSAMPIIKNGYYGTLINFVYYLNNNYIAASNYTANCIVSGSWPGSFSFAGNGAMPVKGQWSSMCYGNGIYVAMVEYPDDNYDVSNIAAYTTDLSNAWTKVTLPYSAYGHHIAWGNGKFVAISKRPSYSYGLYSTNGKTWTKFTTFPSDSGAPIMLKYIDNKFVVIKSNGKVLTSTNGTTWTTVGTISVNTSTQWTSATYGNGMYIAHSYNSNIIAYSTDAVNWASTTLPNSRVKGVMAYNGSRFLFAPEQSDYYSYSKNGVDWTDIKMPLTIQVTSIAASPSYFMVGGYSNDIVFVPISMLP